MYELDYEGFATFIRETLKRPSGKVRLCGIPEGGLHLVKILHEYDADLLLAEPAHADAIVDDIVDSGETAKRWLQYGKPIIAATGKPTTPEIDGVRIFTYLKGWVEFPWETKEEAVKELFYRFCQLIGEHPEREGLKGTPDRLHRALPELFGGYREDPEKILSRRFKSGTDEMVVMRDISFVSFCEHHLLPFSGEVDIAYIPGGHVIGASKLIRLTRVFSRRLQLQERLTSQIANALVAHLSQDCAVVVKAKHLCMGCRGVRDPRAEMVTSAVRGVFKTDERARAELLQLIRLNRN